MSAGLVAALFVAAALVAAGAFTVAWRREATAALAGVPLMLGGAGVAFAAADRFAAASGPHLAGQEMQVLVAVAALALVALGVGMAGRESPR